MKRVEGNEVNIMPNAMLRYKYIVITFVILMISTLSVAVFALATNYRYINEMAELRAQNQHNSDLATRMLRATRAANDNTKCKPLSQDELPAANLFGKNPYTVSHNDLERDVPSHMETGVYRWLTPHHDYGLLTGGMTFNETSGHLRIPKSGTYYMFSTIRFRRNKDLDTDMHLTVDIKTISYGCNFRHSGNKGYNSGFNPKHYVVIPKGKVGGYYSAHTSSIARMCENDVIYLHIHNMKSEVVIRNGGGAYTNLGAFMIAPQCQEDTDPVSTTNADTTPTTSAEATSSPPDKCSRRDCQ